MNEKQDTISRYYSWFQDVLEDCLKTQEIQEKICSELQQCLKAFIASKVTKKEVKLHPKPCEEIASSVPVPALLFNTESIADDELLTRIDQVLKKAHNVRNRYPVPTSRSVMKGSTISLEGQQSSSTKQKSLDLYRSKSSSRLPTVPGTKVTPVVKSTSQSHVAVVQKNKEDCVKKKVVSVVDKRKQDGPLNDKSSTKTVQTSQTVQQKTISRSISMNSRSQIVKAGPKSVKSRSQSVKLLTKPVVGDKNTKNKVAKKNSDAGNTPVLKSVLNNEKKIENSTDNTVQKEKTEESTTDKIVTLNENAEPKGTLEQSSEALVDSNCNNKENIVEDVEGNAEDGKPAAVEKTEIPSKGKPTPSTSSSPPKKPKMASRQRSTTLVPIKEREPKSDEKPKSELLKFLKCVYKTPLERVFKGDALPPDMETVLDLFWFAMKKSNPLERNVKTESETMFLQALERYDQAQRLNLEQQMIWVLIEKYQELYRSIERFETMDKPDIEDLIEKFRSLDTELRDLVYDKLSDEVTSGVVLNEVHFESSSMKEECSCLNLSVEDMNNYVRPLGIWFSNTNNKVLKSIFGNRLLQSYSCKEDLLLLTELIQAVQWSQFQCEVNNIVDSLLPILENMEENDTHFLPLFKTVYALSDLNKFEDPVLRKLNKREKSLLSITEEMECLKFLE